MKIKSIAVAVSLAAFSLTGAAQPMDINAGGMEMTLDEALRTALENNLDLVAARMDPEISQNNIRSQSGNFDPLLSSSISHFDQEQETSNLFSLTGFESDAFSVSLAQSFNFGADYSVQLSGDRNTQSGPLVTAESTYGADLAVNFNLPLLRGLGKTAAAEQLLLARGNYEISVEELRRQAQSTIETVEGAYWDLLAARRAYEVELRKLKRAQDLLELNRKKVEVGTMAPIDITQAEAGVASSEEGVIIAETTLLNAEDALRQLLAVPQSDPMWERRLIPADRPNYEAVEIDLDGTIRTALDRRPEMLNARRTLQNNELSERAARNRVRPQLDLALSGTPSGNNFEPGPGPDMIFGTPDDAPIPDGAYSEALSEIPELDSFQWSAALNFSIPLGNKSAKANYRNAKLNRSKSQIAVDNQEQAIRVEVRRAVREVDNGKKRVDAARASVVLEQRKLEAEQKKFENGMSTSFEVLTFQNDLANAELAEIRARLNYLKALAALERVKGTLLEARKLSIASPDSEAGKN